MTLREKEFIELYEDAMNHQSKTGTRVKRQNKFPKRKKAAIDNVSDGRWFAMTSISFIPLAYRKAAAAFAAAAKDVFLQILLHALAGLGGVFGDGDGDLHLIVGGELGTPGHKVLGGSQIGTDGLV